MSDTPTVAIKKLEINEESVSFYEMQGLSSKASAAGKEALIKCQLNTTGKN
jgi:hypothetical protein